MITNHGVASLPGKAHRMNEDRYRILGGAVPPVHSAGRGHVFAVMDGVGSAPKGMKAAQLLADRLSDFFVDSEHVPGSLGGIAAIVREANAEAHAWGTMPGGDIPLAGAAFTIAWFAPEARLYLIHCGDTMAFRYDGTAIRRLTRDHSEGRALRHYLGQAPRHFHMDLAPIAFDEGDILCLVSDGVTKTMAEDEIEAVLTGNGSPTAMATTIAERARGKGSLDDITALVIELEEW